jgi:hypothetical protein
MSRQTRRPKDHWQTDRDGLKIVKAVPKKLKTRPAFYLLARIYPQKDKERKNRYRERLGEQRKRRYMKNLLSPSSSFCRRS